jgi:hypothetical protein
MTSSKETTSIPWFPTDYLFACIDDAEEAARAAAELKSLGLHAQDMALVPGKEAVEDIESACEQCNLALRVLRFLWKFTVDEGIIFLDYAEEAESGHNILAVHIVDSGQLEKARQILFAHHAHRAEYWGHHGTITQLAP